MRAPRAAAEEIAGFVESKREWILKALQKIKAHLPAKKYFVEGEEFFYLGKAYPLRLVNKQLRGVVFKDAFYLPSSLQAKAKQLLEKWYKNEAKEFLQQRLGFYTEAMGVHHKGMKITSASSRWGSCSAKGNINFSFRLIMAPMEVIDYVVVHELAHLAHKNHSQNFWAVVAQFAPQFKPARKWLNRQGHLLQI